MGRRRSIVHYLPGAREHGPVFKRPVHRHVRVDRVDLAVFKPGREEDIRTISPCLCDDLLMVGIIADVGRKGAKWSINRMQNSIALPTPSSPPGQMEFCKANTLSNALALPSLLAHLHPIQP